MLFHNHTTQHIYSRYIYRPTHLQYDILLDKRLKQAQNKLGQYIYIWDIFLK